MATNSTAVGIDHPTIVPTNFEEGAEGGRGSGARDEERDAER